jgi:PAS domain S-box-containing protein
MGDGGTTGGGWEAAGTADFRRLVELAPDPMIVHRRGLLVWANEAAAALVGAPDPGALIGRPVLDFVAPRSRELVVQRIRRMAETGQRAPMMEETFLRLDGTEVEVEVNAAPIGGGVTLVALRDVTERNAADLERRRTDAHLRAFFEASAEAMAISQGGVRLHCNAAYARLFRWDEAAQLVGRPVMDVVPPSRRNEVSDFVQRCVREGRAGTMVTSGLRRDGTEFDMELNLSIHGTGAERFNLVILRDVTERRRDEAAVRASERRYRELFEAVPVALWEEDLSEVRRAVDRLRAAGVADMRAHFAAHPGDLAGIVASARILDVNPAAVALAEAGDKVSLLGSLDRVFIPDSLPAFAELLARAAEGKVPAVVEGWNGTFAGGRRWVQASLRFAPGHDADWARALVSTVDMTARREAEREREAMGERLRHAERMEAVGRLAGGVAHDFNNILTGISGYTELVLDALEPGSQARADLEQVREATGRARALVGQILAFSRRDRPAARPVDLVAVTAEAVQLARAAIPSSITVVTRLEPGAKAVVVDPTQLHQVVLNLCANARDAIGERPGRIEVVVEPHGADGVRLVVRDDGAGMDDETRAHLFEPYRTTKPVGRGHGLGLAVVHGIVTAAGGEVRVESAPGRGAVFEVLLPNVDAAPAAAAMPAPAPGGGSERVLLVDDEPAVRRAARRLLQSLGYQVVTASDGEEALAALRADPAAFDVLVTDQTMPRLTGADLARAALALRPDLPVVLCTGYSEAVDEAAARALGARAFVAKPFDRASLGAAVRAALEVG